jgi:hypothetical protein
MDPEEIARSMDPEDMAGIDPENTIYPTSDGDQLSVNDLVHQGFVEKPVRCFTDNAGIYYFLIDGQWMPLRTD